MSYSLDLLPDGNYKLEIGGGVVCFSKDTFSEFRAEIDKHERQQALRRRLGEEKEKEAMLVSAGVGYGLPRNSIFRRAVADGQVDSTIISAITNGLLYPNGSAIWSAYFSKIDWDNDGHLFEPFLRKDYGENALAHFKAHHNNTMTADIFRLLSDERIDYVNKHVGPGTHLVNIGLTDSRDYTSFSFACAKMYGVDGHERAERCDIDFAKENFETMAETIYDASVFISESSFRARSACPAIEFDSRKDILKESAICAVYLSRFFTERQWSEICESNIWMLVKDIVAARNGAPNIAA